MHTLVKRNLFIFCGKHTLQNKFVGTTEEGDTISDGFNRWKLKAGQTFYAFESQNFGWVCIPAGLTKDNRPLPKTIFKE